MEFSARKLWNFHRFYCEKSIKKITDRSLSFENTQTLHHNRGFTCWAVCANPWKSIQQKSFMSTMSVVFIWWRGKADENKFPHFRWVLSSRSSVNILHGKFGVQQQHLWKFDGDYSIYGMMRGWLGLRGFQNISHQSQAKILLIKSFTNSQSSNLICKFILGITNVCLGTATAELSVSKTNLLSGFCFHLADWGVCRNHGKWAGTVFANIVPLMLMINRKLFVEAIEAKNFGTFVVY